MSPLLEIAVTSHTAAATALALGADRVELCSALELGGVTPSQALVEATLEAGGPTHVLVRSRPGDFVYATDDVQLMCREARAVVRAGAAGVVIGALTPAGELDLAAITAMADAARTVRPDVEITVHRAIDASADPVRCAEALAASGLAPTRLLTSGGAEAVGDALDVVRAMVAAAGPIQVMAGGGVTPAVIPALLGTGVAAVHLSAKRTVREHWELDPAVAAAAVAAMR
jgi:copper homeostasis protein